MAHPAQQPVGEHWWPVAGAIVTIAGLHLLLPDHFRLEPIWLTPAVLLSLLAALVLGDPGRIDRDELWLRVVTGIVIGAVTLANVSAAVRLVRDILDSDKRFADDPRGLLGTGGVIC